MHWIILCLCIWWAEVDEVLAEEVCEELHEEQDISVLLLLRLLRVGSPPNLVLKLVIIVAE